VFKRIDSFVKGKPFKITVDGELFSAFPGETLATILLTSGKIATRKTLKDQNLRGYYCGMGVCSECVLMIEDGFEVRACQTLAKPNLKVKTLL